MNCDVISLVQPWMTYSINCRNERIIDLWCLIGYPLSFIFIKLSIKEKYGISESKLRIYVHYQPSYYHFHVHFTHLQFLAPGSNVERAHLLRDVIENLELYPNYYSQKTLSFVIQEGSALITEYRKHGRLS